MDIEAIAIQRGLKTTTVFNHLANGIELDEIPLNDVVKLESQQIEAIRFAIEQFEGGKRLKWIVNYNNMMKMFGWRVVLAFVEITVESR